MSKLNVENAEILKKINSTIVGRNIQIDQIKLLFDNVLNGNSSTLLLKGNSGVGKTFLVQHIINSLQNGHITFAQGKHIQNSKVPFVALSEIFDGVFENILTLPVRKYNHILNKLEVVLGSDLEFICDLSTIAKNVFNQKYNNNKSCSRSKYRIKKLVELFFLCIAETFYPLVIFIDDLQWADTITLEILNMMCKEQTANFLLVLACRNNYIDKSLEKIDADVIELAPLNESDIKIMVKRIFGQSIENITYLGRILYSLTLGNPFYIKRTLEMFCNKGILIYDEDLYKWISDINKINSIELPSGIEQLIKTKMQSLDSDQKLLLQYITCLDGSATLEQIELLLSTKIDNIHKPISVLSENSFIVERDRGIYYIVHDIILELVTKSINEVQKNNIHYNIAKVTLENLDNEIERYLPFISSQLIRTDFNTWQDTEKEKWVKLLFDAGMQTSNIAAYDRGIEIFSACNQILTSNNYQSETLEISVMLELAKCEYYSGDFKEAENIFAELMNSFSITSQNIVIKKEYMKMLAFKGDDIGVIRVGKEVLSLLNYDYDINNLLKELEEVKNLYSDEFIDNIKSMKRIESKKLINILETLYQMMTSAQIHSEEQFIYILIKIAIISAKEGSSDYSILGYEASAYVFYHIIGDMIKGDKLSNLVMVELDNVRDEALKAKVIGFFATFVHHWVNPINETKRLLESSNTSCIELGEVLYAEYTLASLMFINCVQGENLVTFKQNIYGRIEALKNITNKQFTVNHIEKCLEDHFSYLISGDSNNQITFNSFKCNESSYVLVYLWFYLQDSYFSGDIVKAYAIVENFEDKLERAKGHIIYTEVVFYSLLIRLEYHNELDDKSKQANEIYINELLRFLERVCSYFKDNHIVKCLYARGMYDAVFGEGSTTSGLYNEGIKLAEESNNTLLEAVGNMIASKFYNEYLKLSLFYKNEAALCFAKWGALHIAKLIGYDDNKNDIIKSKSIDRINIDDIISQSIKQIDELDEVDAFTYMIEKIISIARCEYGAILFEQSDEMYVYYEKQVNHRAIHYKSPLIINYSDNISKKIVRYVARTGEKVLLSERPTNGLFAHDNHIVSKQYISVLCVPFYYFNILIGVIYIENNEDNNIDTKVLSFINGIIPTLMAKCEKIKDINMSDFLSPTKSISPLTDRETDILELVAQGLSNSEISEKKYISTGTVKTHLSSIYNKLDVDSRIKAVVKAKEMNIL